LLIKTHEGMGFAAIPYAIHELASAALKDLKPEVLVKLMEEKVDWNCERNW
jgi:hypothetical protein